MQINNTNTSESEISLVDILQFLQDAWKKLAAAAIAGAILGLAAWLFFLGQYHAEYVLLNNTNTHGLELDNTNTYGLELDNTNTYGLDLVSWKMIQKSLPNLAAQMLEDGRVPEGQVSLYRSLADDQWWKENAIPNFVLSKADIRDLAGPIKNIDGASTAILSLTVSAEGLTKDSAVNVVKGAVKFLRSGGAYLQIRNMLNGYAGDTVNGTAEIQKKITSMQIEMSYQRQRAKSLEDLYRRYPSNTNMGQQVVDPKESGAKYLSIATQIIAANNDINQTKEVLNRLNDRLAQLSTAKLFLAEAIPLAETTFDGLALSDQLIAIERKIRSTLDKGDQNQLVILDQIHSQIVMIQERFSKGLEANAPPTTSNRKAISKSIFGGSACGFLLMLLVLLGQRVWYAVKIMKPS